MAVSRQRAWAKLTRPALRGGNVTQALCSVAEWVGSGDYHSACNKV